MMLYVGAAGYNLYKLMHPLVGVDLSSVPDDQFVRALWKSGEPMHMRIYLSTRPKFSWQFLEAGYETERKESRGESQDDDEEEKDTERRVASSRDDDVVRGDVSLLWDETVDSPAFSKSFVLAGTTSDNVQDDPSYKFASSWLDSAEKAAALERNEGVVSAVVSGAGHGIESTSILLTLYQTAARHVRSLLASAGLVDPPVELEPKQAGILDRKVVRVSPESPIWTSVRSNSTLFVHVLCLKASSIEGTTAWPPATSQDLQRAVQSSYRNHALLSGQVDLVKFDAPHHIGKPSRILYRDVVYLFRRYVARSVSADEHSPWNMEYSKPEEYAAYRTSLDMKKRGAGYPYWKPEVAVKYVSDTVEYPLQYVGASGMPIVQVPRHPEHPTGYSYMPAIHVDEIGLTSEKYIPINETVTALPLRISFDRSDMEHPTMPMSSATAGGISPSRWRLLTHLSQALESQKRLGFEQSDIDELRRLIADTNVTLLAITLLASALHMLFEFLTFKNEVSFWSKNKDLTGLSVRSLFLDLLGQSVILMYLIERDSSLLITIPSGIGCLIALWKSQRAAGLKFVRVDGTASGSGGWWNFFPRQFGYELRATRLEIRREGEGAGNDADGAVSHKDRLAILTIESDRIATRTLGSLLLPLVLGYTIYSFVREEHMGWYSWLVTSASSAVYALGFVLMTPQLFLNWKLKSVAHLPWRVLVYKSLNTFIDDLFSFVIRMPTMARISCFRDDVVFFIYLYQRWLYPVDETRPIEGGGEGHQPTMACPTKDDLDKKKKQ